MNNVINHNSLLFVIIYLDFDGDKVTICNSADFETFLGYKISKVYVNCKRGPRSKQTNEEGMAGTSTHRGNVDKDLPSSNCTLASTSANKVNYDSDNGEDNNEDKTLENVQMDPNASVIESVAIMIDMGFENDDNWLDDVLQLAQGDISEVIEFLSPIAVD